MMGSGSGAFETRPLPLVVGVTGHRDLREEDLEGLRARVREVLRELQVAGPSTPLVVLSPLAEGADRLVAEVALEEGATLIAPLPLPVAEYERDFRADGSLAEFQRLLGRAERVFVVGPAEGRREEAYWRVGAYVARNCQVMIALWDGVESNKVGGTSEIVGFRLKGVPRELDPGRSLLDSPEVGPVVVVGTPRVANPDVVGALAAEWRYPEEAAGGAMGFGKVRRLIEQYNRDVRTYSAEIEARAEGESRRYLLAEGEREGLPSGLLATMDRYATADLLAQIHQRRTYRLLDLILGMTFVMALLFQLHIHWRKEYPTKDATNRPVWGQPLWARRVFPTGSDWLARRGVVVPESLRGTVRWMVYERDLWLAAYDLVYLGMLGLTIGVFLLSRRRGQQTRYQDYRALAEGLRVQFYWRLVGLRDSAADHYLRKQKGELDWIRAALRVGDLLEGVRVPEGKEEMHRMRVVLAHWVKEQVLYFVGIERDEARAERGWRLWRLWAGPDFSARYLGKAQARRDDWKGGRNRKLASALLLGVFPALAVARGFAPPWNLLVILLVMASVVLFLVGVHAKVRAFSEHAKSYGRMGIVFGNARRVMGVLLDKERVGEARDLLRELGGEALAENADWLLLHRERPLELPRA